MLHPGQGNSKTVVLMFFASLFRSDSGPHLPAVSLGKLVNLDKPRFSKLFDQDVTRPSDTLLTEASARS